MVERCLFMACLPIGPTHVVSIALDSFAVGDGHHLREVEVGHFDKCL